MDCKSKFCATMALVLAASPALISAQVPQQQPPRQQPPQQQPAPQLKVVATVNGDPITDREVQTRVQAHLRGQQVDPQTAQGLQQQVVDNLIESRLVEQFVLDKGPEVEPEEIKETLGQVRKQVTAQNSSFDQFLAMRGYTADMFENRIKGSLAWQKYQQDKVTERELQRHFEQNKERFNAQELSQVRGQVTDSLIGEIWGDIVGQMKPKAKIQMAGAEPPQPQRRQPIPLPNP